VLVLQTRQEGDVSDTDDGGLHTVPGASDAAEPHTMPAAAGRHHRSQRLYKSVIGWSPGVADWLTHRATAVDRTGLEIENAVVLAQLATAKLS